MWRVTQDKRVPLLILFQNKQIANSLYFLSTNSYFAISFINVQSSQALAWTWGTMHPQIGSFIYYLFN